MMTFFILLNWGIAMGGFSVVHDVMKETRSDQLRQREEEGQQARENRAKIDALRKAAGYDTPEMITAEIAKLKKDRRFQSSGGCATDGEKKITVKASESLCQEIDTLTGRLSAAKKIASLEDERRARGWKLGTDMENNAALSSDPMIDNLTQIVLTLFNLSVSAKLMGAIVAAVKALGVELLADVLPPIIVMLCRMLSAGGTASSTLRKTDIPEIAGASPELIKTNPPAMLALEILPDTSNPPEPLKQAPETNPPATPLNPPVDVLNAPTQMRTGESDLRRWTSEYLTLREGSGLQSKPLYEVYVVWAEARGIEPVTIAIFGRLMPLIGYPKLKDKKTGLMVYQGVALKQHNLKVVK